MIWIGGISVSFLLVNGRLPNLEHFQNGSPSSTDKLEKCIQMLQVLSKNRVKTTRSNEVNHVEFRQQEEMTSSSIFWSPSVSDPVNKTTQPPDESTDRGMQWIE
jgi:hypothetical protein